MRRLRSRPAPETHAVSAFAPASAAAFLRRRVTSTKNDGTNRMPNTVAAIVPPSTLVPIAVRPPDPAPLESTSGRTPSENAIEVMMIGRKRCRAAVRTASNSDSPAS